MMNTELMSKRFFENETSGTLDIPESFRQWQSYARALLKPLTGLMVEGEAHLEIEGPASDHDRNADRLEAMARPLLLFCHWERSTRFAKEAGDEEVLEQSKGWYRQALLVGSDPKSDRFFGYSANFHQHSVEMGLLVIALELSRDWLWDSYSSDEKDQILDWLESDVGNGHHWNNHMYFGIFVMEFLLQEGRGRASFRGVIDRWFSELEGMYAGNGWYMDGMNQAFDFYNAYAWHYYSSWWVVLYGETNTKRCERLLERTKRFLVDYPNFFADSGEHPAFGRSITYRFNATAPVALAHVLGASPLSGGQARGLCQRNLEFFMSKPICNADGAINLGWYDRFEPLVEVYSCGGSPYWAGKAFAPLLLRPDDSFWVDAESRIDAADEVALVEPSLIVRRVKGEVELINVGSQIASTNTRFGPHKWGRISYKTSFGFALAKGTGYPLDGGLTAQKVGSEVVYGRHYTAPFDIGAGQAGFLYSLGGKLEQFQVSVESRIWWKSNWQLQAHRVLAKDAATLRLGSHALASAEASDLELKNGFGQVSAFVGEKGVCLQPLHGFETCSFDARLKPEDGPRRHIQAEWHATALCEAHIKAGESRWLISLSWAGHDAQESQPWEIISSEAGLWVLRHEELGEWKVEEAELPAVEVK